MQWQSPLLTDYAFGVVENGMVPSHSTYAGTTSWQTEVLYFDIEKPANNIEYFIEQFPNFPTELHFSFYNIPIPTLEDTGGLPWDGTYEFSFDLSQWGRYQQTVNHNVIMTTEYKIVGKNNNNNDDTNNNVDQPAYILTNSFYISEFEFTGSAIPTIKQWKFFLRPEQYQNNADATIQISQLKLDIYLGAKAPGMSFHIREYCFRLIAVRPIIIGSQQQNILHRQFYVPTHDAPRALPAPDLIKVADVYNPYVKIGPYIKLRNTIDEDYVQNSRYFNITFISGLNVPLTPYGILSLRATSGTLYNNFPINQDNHQNTLFQPVPENNWTPRFLTTKTADYHEQELGWSCQFITNTTTGEQEVLAEVLAVSYKNALQFTFPSQFNIIRQSTPFLLYCPNWIITAPDTERYADEIGNVRFYLIYEQEEEQEKKQDQQQQKQQNQVIKKMYGSNFPLPYLGGNNRPPASGHPYIFSPLRLTQYIDYIMIEIKILDLPGTSSSFMYEFYFVLNITGITPRQSSGDYYEDLYIGQAILDCRNDAGYLMSEDTSSLKISFYSYGPQSNPYNFGDNTPYYQITNQRYLRCPEDVPTSRSLRIYISPNETLTNNIIHNIRFSFSAGSSKSTTYHKYAKLGQRHVVHQASESLIIINNSSSSSFLQQKDNLFLQELTTTTAATHLSSPSVPSSLPPLPSIKYIDFNITKDRYDGHHQYHFNFTIPNLALRP
eukprot:UN00477